jgi:hypothetical protein
VLLETNDGRPHLEQVIPVIKAGKRVFVDKPIAGSLADAVAIHRLAAKRGVPLFSASSLRFAAGTLAVRGGSIGAVTGADTYSPCALEATHPDLFWYGIHGVESLFTAMGPGCTSVTRTHSADFDLVTGLWSDGRIGTFRGIRRGAANFGGTAFGEKGTAPVGAFDGYRPLLVEIVKFFQTGEAPVSAEETLNLGLQMRIQLIPDKLALDLGYERYMTRGTDGSTSQSAYPDAHSFTAGIHYQF